MSEGRRPRRPRTHSAISLVGDGDVPTPTPSCVRAGRWRGDVLVARERIPQSHWSGTGTSPLPRLRVCEQGDGGATSSSPASAFRNPIGRGRGRPHSHAFVRASRAMEGRRPRRPRAHSAISLVGDGDVPTPTPSCVRAGRWRGDVLVARERIPQSHWSGTGTSPLLRLRACEQGDGGATSSSPANAFRNPIGRGRPHSTAASIESGGRGSKHNGG